jgi:hypothetical protein
MVQGGSNFGSMSAADGVKITERGIKKIGKSIRTTLDISKDLHLLNTTRTTNNKTIDFTLPNLRESRMDDTIEMNSTIKSNKVDESFDVYKRTDESHYNLPAINSSRFSLGRNSSMSKLTSNDKINITDKSIDFVKHSMILKHNFQDKKMKVSKSEMSLTSLLPDKKMPLNHFIPMSKVDCGSTFRPMMRASGYIMNNEESIKRFDDFNRQLLHNSMIPNSGSLKLLKLGKKPKVNRSKYFIDKSKPVLLNQEHRDNKKSYIDRMLELKQTRKSDKYSEL